MKANEEDGEEYTSTRRTMASADVEAETLIRQLPPSSAASTAAASGTVTGIDQLRFHHHHHALYPQQPQPLPPESISSQPQHQHQQNHQFVPQSFQFQQQQSQFHHQPFNLQFHQQYSPHFGMRRFGTGAVSPQIQQQILLQQQQQQQIQLIQHQQQLYQARFQTQQQQQFVRATQAPAVAAVKNVATVAVEKTGKESAPSGTKRKGGTGGLSKLCGLSPELQAVLGQSALARTEVVKQLWVYIRKHNLQDPSNKRKIICDEALRLVFETDCTDMFKMNKLLSKHIFPLKATNESAPDKRSKVDAQEEISLGTETVCTTVISEELAKFLGTTSRDIDPIEATNSVWDYIKANSLEDSDAMVINCDDKLRELLQCESVPISGLNEILSHHLVQSS
ncbi:Upstream activation factor subunit spp27-like protein [Drosera capensis]